MALRSGLAAQIGIAAESTWGTRVVPTRFLEFPNEELALTIERIESAAIRATNRVLRSDRWVAGQKNAGGTATWEVANKGFGLLLKHMLGAVIISTPGGGILARDHTHTLGDMDNLSLTVQVGRPDVGGVVRPFEYAGAKITSWEISNSVGPALAEHHLRCPE